MNRLRGKTLIAVFAVIGFATVQAKGSIVINASSVPFLDISGTGTVLAGISDDSEGTIAGATHGWVGNDLFAGGMSIRIGNNGGILWGNSATDTFTGATDVGYYNAGPLNSTLPAGSQSSIATMLPLNGAATGNGNNLRQFVAPLWDDYVPVSGGATTRIFWQVVGNDLVVEWFREDAFAATGAGDVTFQAIFRGGVTYASGNSLVDFIYQDTLFATAAYQNDGGSATIGYKNWGINAGANDVEFGIGGGTASATSDASGLGRQPKISGWTVGEDSNLPHSVSITPEPATLTLLAFGAVALIRRRR